MHILVTGGCSFVGSHMSCHFRFQGGKGSVMDNLVRRASGKNIARFRGEVFNLGGGAANSVSFREATTAMQDISSHSAPITKTAKARQGDIVLNWTDNRKAVQQLGWKPKTYLGTGFVRIFDWIRENEAELRSRYVSSKRRRVKPCSILWQSSFRMSENRLMLMRFLLPPDR